MEPDSAIAPEVGHLARYKVPRAVTVVDGPLRDEPGEVRRSALLERYGSLPAARTN